MYVFVFGFICVVSCVQGAAETARHALAEEQIAARALRRQLDEVKASKVRCRVHVCMCVIPIHVSFVCTLHDTPPIRLSHHHHCIRWPPPPRPTKLSPPSSAPLTIYAVASNKR